MPGTSDLVLAGTTNFLAKYVNSADVGNSAVYETGGCRGSGRRRRSTDARAVHQHQRRDDGAGSAEPGNTATSYSGMLFYDQNGALGQFQGFNNVTHEYRINNIARNGSSVLDGSINFMIGGSSKFFVASNGNIGIGTIARAQLRCKQRDLGYGERHHPPRPFATAGNFESFVGTPGARHVGGADGRAEWRLSWALRRAWLWRDGIRSRDGLDARVATENWTDTAQGTRLVLPPLVTERYRQRQDGYRSSGNLGLGTFSPSAAMEVVREGTPAGFLATTL